MTSEQLWSQAVFWTNTVLGWLIRHGVAVIVILVLTIVFYRLWVMGVRRLEALVHDDDPDVNALERRVSTIGSMARNAGLVVILCVAFIMVLQQLGLDVGPLLAGAGVVGIAISLGAQSLVKDLLGGFLILMEDQFRVGDVIQAGGVSGTVERMNLRTTVLRGRDGTMHVVPNGAINVVSNMTRQWSQVLMDVGVAYESELEHVTAVLADIGHELAADPAWASSILEPPTVLG
ncbi:MAG: mechanosensitive ion channel family protein, partial [Chloroflexi bacterium]|nr:mechanosensitive ion channel family protein [Chloroflexota bacterium]